jgi:RNA-directed DNA polymerase
VQERGLDLSAEKTTIPPSKDGFEFLGQPIRQYHGKILVKPSRQSGHTLLTKVRVLIKATAQATTGKLISQLNPLIRGWAYSHRHVSSKQTFATVDHAIFRALWPWAKRRPPHNSRRWIKEADFQVSEGCRGVFCGQRPGKDGPPQRVRLFAAASVAIKRPPKIKGAATPLDPAGEGYFEQRLGVTMADNLKGRRKLLSLGKAQNGRWPAWHQPITPLTGWENHPLIGRTNGGADHAANRVLRHPNCHRQVHRQG